MKTIQAILFLWLHWKEIDIKVKEMICIEMYRILKNKYSKKNKFYTGEKK